MGLAPLAYVLWTKFLKHNPRNPKWHNRDRFVLSGGHASMLLYSLLHLTGYDLPLEQLKQFRQWESRTPGHPDYGLTPGVETTTGPLGQGLGNAGGQRIQPVARVLEGPVHRKRDLASGELLVDDAVGVLEHRCTKFAAVTDVHDQGPCTLGAEVSSFSQEL